MKLYFLIGITNEEDIVTYFVSSNLKRVKKEQGNCKDLFIVEKQIKGDVFLDYDWFDDLLDREIVCFAEEDE